MIWRRIRPSTKKEDEEFADRFEQQKVPFSERLIMMLTGFAVVVVPAALFLVGFGLLILLIFRAL